LILITYLLFILSLYLKVEAPDFLLLFLFVILISLILIILVIFFIFILLPFGASFFEVFPKYNLIIL